MKTAFDPHTHPRDEDGHFIATDAVGHEEDDNEWYPEGLPGGVVRGRPIEVIPDDVVGAWWVLRKGEHVGTVWPGQLFGFWTHCYGTGRAIRTESFRRAVRLALHPEKAA